LVDGRIVEDIDVTEHSNPQEGEAADDIVRIPRTR